MRAALLTLTLLLAAVAAPAQTPTTGTPLVWDQPNVADAAEAQSFTYRYYADGAATGIVLAGVVCSGSAPVICQAPFPAFTPGPHSLTLTASNSAGESAPSAALAFTFVVVPTSPANLRIGG